MKRICPIREIAAIAMGDCIENCAWRVETECAIKILAQQLIKLGSKAIP